MKLQLYYPVSPVSVNQKFGEVANLQYYLDHGISFIGHNGIDFKASHGQPVYAAHDGIAYYEVDSSQGDGIVLLTNQAFDYDSGPAYFKTIYWHLIDNILTSQGQVVKAGDIIGYADSTGLSTGDHLHFGLKPVTSNEPAFAWTNINQNNGYMGAIDPQPYFNGLSASDLNIDHKSHVFTTPMMIGDTSEEVKTLQKCLRSLGYFPLEQECTGYYGSITRSSVFAFQKANCITDVASFINVWGNLGGRVGPLTLTALNRMQK